jgi:hypothetical protein
MKDMETSKKPLPERELRIKIRAGDRECFTWYPSDDHRCPYLMTRRFGVQLCCDLFAGVDLLPVDYNENGLPVGALRCKACLEAEHK